MQVCTYTFLHLKLYDKVVFLSKNSHLSTRKIIKVFV